jgi:hypothetical protein
MNSRFLGISFVPRRKSERAGQDLVCLRQCTLELISRFLGISFVPRRISERAGHDLALNEVQDIVRQRQKESSRSLYFRRKSERAGQDLGHKISQYVLKIHKSIDLCILRMAYL